MIPLDSDSIARLMQTASLPYLFLAIAVLAVMTPDGRWWKGALPIAVITGLATGALHSEAVVGLVSLTFACWLHTSYSERLTGLRRTALRGGGFVVIVALCLASALHLLPGVHNRPIVIDQPIKIASAAYSIWLNFDKPGAGLILLGLCYLPVRQVHSNFLVDLRLALLPLLGTVGCLTLLSLAAGFVAWEPGVSDLFWLWAPVNLLFTCMSEEAFFRGFLQVQLTGWLQPNTRFAGALAIAASALLFGLSHAGGGWTYVGLATIAGVGYAAIFQRTGRLELAILTHFCANAVHFILFTYPRAQ